MSKGRRRNKPTPSWRIKAINKIIDNIYAHAAERTVARPDRDRLKFISEQSFALLGLLFSDLSNPDLDSLMVEVNAQPAVH